MLRVIEAVPSFAEADVKIRYGEYEVDAMDELQAVERMLGDKSDTSVTLIVLAPGHDDFLAVRVTPGSTWVNIAFEDSGDGHVLAAVGELESIIESTRGRVRRVLDPNTKYAYLVPTFASPLGLAGLLVDDAALKVLLIGAAYVFLVAYHWFVVRAGRLSIRNAATPGMTTWQKARAWMDANQGPLTTLSLIAGLIAIVLTVVLTS